MAEKHHKQVQKQSLFQILSLDVVIGSLSTGLFAVVILDVQPSIVWWFILPLSVWTIYTLDHLMDGYRTGARSSIYRHWFHHKNKIRLFVAILITGILSAVLSVAYFDGIIIKSGIALILLVLLYLLIVYFLDKLKIRYFQKELFIAIVYVSGIFLAPLAWFGGAPSPPVLWLIGILIVLAWCEGAIISWFDYTEDMQNGHYSFTVMLGLRKARTAILTTGIFTLLIIIFLLFQNQGMLYQTALIIELIMLSILMLLIYKPNYFKKRHLFRWLGEGVFYLPGLIVLLT